MIRLPHAIHLGLLALLVACGGSSDRKSSHQRSHLLVLGWDGATFDMLDPLMRAGRLPNLARLQAQGVSANLESTAIPISSAAWTAAMTGVGPGANGIYGFFEPIPDSYEVRLVDSTRNQAPPLWRILNARDRTVHVFGVPLTWPPEPVSGVMVAGMLSPPDADYAWPKGMAQRLRKTGFVPDLGTWRGTRAVYRERVLNQLALKEQALVSLLERDDWDAAIAVFKSLDVVCHQIYDGRTEHFVADVLERLDAILGRLLEAAGPTTDVLLMSDHGFASYRLGFNLHPWLIEQGFATRSSTPSKNRGQATSPLAEQRPLAHKRRVSALNLDETIALAGECEGNFGSIRLNLVGREPAGTVTDEQRKAVMSRIERQLRAYAPGGTPLIEQVWQGAQLYPGGAPAVPDLIFQVREDHLVSAEESEAVLVRYPAPRPDHARNGVFIAAGPRIRRDDRRKRFSILDTTPTILHLMGLAVHNEMGGTVRTEICADQRPVVRTPRADDGPLRRLDEDSLTPLTKDQVDDIVTSLQSLGYVDSYEEEEGDDE